MDATCWLPLYVIQLSGGQADAESLLDYMYISLICFMPVSRGGLPDIQEENRISRRDGMRVRRRICGDGRHVVGSGRRLKACTALVHGSSLHQFPPPAGLGDRLPRAGHGTLMYQEYSCLIGFTLSVTLFDKRGLRCSRHDFPSSNRSAR